MDLTFTWRGNALAMLIKANLSQGWHQFGSGSFGFAEQQTIDLNIEDWRVRTKIDVRSQPARRSFPDSLEAECENQMFLCRVRNGRLSAVVDIGSAMGNVLPSKQRGASGNWTLATYERTKYRLAVLVVLKPPPGARTGDIREFDLLPYAPGGLPSLGRRRP